MISPVFDDLTALTGQRPGRSVTASALDGASPEALQAVAKEFEATFLAEMLKHTGLGEPRDAFGGGHGEAAFASMLTQEYATQLAKRGGIGLADRIASELAARQKG